MSRISLYFAVDSAIRSGNEYDHETRSRYSNMVGNGSKVRYENIEC